MWRTNASVLALLILMNLALSMAGPALWIAAAAAGLMAGIVVCFRRGISLGIAACSVSDVVETTQKDGTYDQLDKAFASLAWRPAMGLKAALISSAVPWVAGALYIALSLTAPDALLPLTLSRTAAWLLSLPYWPFIAPLHSDFVTLTPDIAVMLLTTPFILPLCSFAGYMRGPLQWMHRKEVLARSRRRAKARSRVGHKNYK